LKTVTVVIINPGCRGTKVKLKNPQKGPVNLEFLKGPDACFGLAGQLKGQGNPTEFCNVKKQPKRQAYRKRPSTGGNGGACQGLSKGEKQWER